MLTGLDGPQLTSPARLGPECNRPGPVQLFLLIYGPGRAARPVQGTTRQYQRGLFWSGNNPKFRYNYQCMTSYHVVTSCIVTANVLCVFCILYRTEINWLIDCLICSFIIIEKKIIRDTLPAHRWIKSSQVKSILRSVPLIQQYIPTSHKERRFRFWPAQSGHSFHQAVFQQRVYIHSRHWVANPGDRWRRE